MTSSGTSVASSQFAYPVIQIFDKNGLVYEKEFVTHEVNGSTVPKLNFDTPPGISPFCTPHQVSLYLRKKEALAKLGKEREIDILKRKRSRDSGWCECCEVKFSNQREVLCFFSKLVFWRHLFFSHLST